MLQGKCLENVNRFVKIAVFTSLSKKIYVSHQVEIVDFTILERRKFRERIYCIFIENSFSNCRRSRRRRSREIWPATAEKTTIRSSVSRRSSVLRLRNARPINDSDQFSARTCPNVLSVHTNARRIRARVTYDLLLFEEERKPTSNCIDRASFFTVKSDP